MHGTSRRRPGALTGGSARSWPERIRVSAPVVTLLGLMLGLTVLAVLVLVLQLSPRPGPVPAGGLPTGFVDGGSYTLTLLGTLLAVLGLIFSTAGAALGLWLKDRQSTAFEGQYRQLEMLAGEVVRRTVDDAVRPQARMISRLGVAITLVETSLAHWMVYERGLRDAETPGADPAVQAARLAAGKDALDLAIAAGESAMVIVYPEHNPDPQSISNLLGDDYELRFKGRLLSNQGFYLVTRARPQDLELAASRVARTGAAVAACQQADSFGWREMTDSHLWAAWKAGVLDGPEVAARLRALRRQPPVREPWETRYLADGLTI